MTFRIPAALQPYAAQPRWVVRRYEKKAGGSKPTKVPYQPQAPSDRAMPNRPSTWSDAQKAIDTVEKNGFDGIGICLLGYEQIAFDIDHCRDPTTVR
jgi:primase-polymerase (primpol)-like protein